MLTTRSIQSQTLIVSQFAYTYFLSFMADCTKRGRGILIWVWKFSSSLNFVYPTPDRKFYISNMGWSVCIYCWLSCNVCGRHVMSFPLEKITFFFTKAVFVYYFSWNWIHPNVFIKFSFHGVIADFREKYVNVSK